MVLQGTEEDSDKGWREKKKKENKNIRDGTVVLAMSLEVVVLLVMNPTTCAYSLSQLCLATSKRSARFLGSGTSILFNKSRACGVTYSGKVRGVDTMYLYRRLMLSPSGFAGSSSKGR
jgi:hypothetical protein